MKYLSRLDCEKYCDRYGWCERWAAYLKGWCILEGEGFQKGPPQDKEERERRIARLQEKLAQEGN